MKYLYSPAFSIKGIVAPTDAAGISIVSEPGFRALLTSDLDKHTDDGDRSSALAGMMLNAVFRSTAITDDLREQLDAEVDKIRQTRKLEHRGGPYLVIQAEGQVDSIDQSRQRENEDFVVCLEAVDKDQIRALYESRITALITAIISEVDTIVEIKKVTSAVVLYRDDGKPVYSFTFSMGRANAFISRPLGDAQVQRIAHRYKIYETDTVLQRVQRLLRSSFEKSGDPLRSFLAAWSSFEIFVNKVFSRYEEQFFQSLLEEEHTNAQGEYLRRIREVMKDKYRLVDKFAAVSFQLSPGTADEDLRIVTQVKKVRDNLAHGESVDESGLPVNEIREIAAKYIRIHVASLG